MNDLISRQQAIKAIEESKLEVWLNHYEHDDGYNEGLETAIEEIQELPSAQPEIIYCKDCKYYGRADKKLFYRGADCLNNHIRTIVADKDYCSRAERRTDDN